MAAPLLDAQGQTIGIVALTSRRRRAYTVEDGAFLRTVIGHAAMAIQNATIYQLVDGLSRVDPLTGLFNRREFDRRSLEFSRVSCSTRLGGTPAGDCFLKATVKATPAPSKPGHP
jgi:GGDEF domain-containing protein